MPKKGKNMKKGGSASSPELSPAQKQIHQDKSRFKVVCCGRRFGKTKLASYSIVKEAVFSGEPRYIAYIAPTYQQARDIAWNELVAMLHPWVQDKTGKKAVNEARMEIATNVYNPVVVGNNLELQPVEGTSQIYFKGWEAISTLRGMKFHYIVIDEIAMMKSFWEEWEEIIRPTLTDFRGRVLFLSTPKGFNHFYDLYNRDKEDRDWKSFHFTTYDNPFIPEGIPEHQRPAALAQELEEAKRQMTEDRFAQEYLADFRKTEGLVYKEFSRKQHVYDLDSVPSEFSETIAGVDFGYNAPACILSIGIDKDKVFWVTNEWYKTRQTGPQIAEQCALFHPNLVYPDVAEPDKVEDLRKAGLNVRESSKDIVNGVDKVRELFKQGRIRVSPLCKNLLLELETYRYPDRKPGKNERELPVKDNDHAVDALRYALYTHEPQPLTEDNYRLYATQYL
jgi:phage terminase large subunit